MVFSLNEIACVVDSIDNRCMMKRSTLVSIAVLVVPFVVVLGLFYSFISGDLAHILIAEKKIEARGQFGDSFGVLSSLFSGLGFAGVVGTIWLQQLQIGNQESARLTELAERRSQFHLDTSANAYSQAWTLLQDQNNSRHIWIRAGRLLGHARLSAAKVTVDEHKLSLEITRLEYRTFFSELLETRSAAFFYGGDAELTVEEAAQQSSLPRVGQGQYTLSLRDLAVESLYEVWEASRWPESYDDPLDQTFSEDDRGKVKFLSRGLDEYLAYRDNWVSLGGVVRPRRRSAPRPAGEAS